MFLKEAFMYSTFVHSTGKLIIYKGKRKCQMFTEHCSSNPIWKTVTQILYGKLFDKFFMEPYLINSLWNIVQQFCYGTLFSNSVMEHCSTILLWNIVQQFG